MLSTGAAIGQNLDPVGTQIYLSGRIYDLETTFNAAAANPDEVIAIILAARAKF